MKRKRAYLRIFIFMVVLVLPSVLWLVFKAAGVTDALDFDLGEKRNKHEIALSKGGANLTSELEAWYNDRVPFRSIILKAEGAVSGAIETPYDKLIEPALIAAVNRSLRTSMGDPLQIARRIIRS